MKNTLFNNYTMNCLKGKARMQTTINPYSSAHKIRSYMFGEHNDNARQEIHKAIPYHISDPKIQRAISKEFLQTIRQTGISLPDKLKDYVVIHAGLPVDTLTTAQARQYTSNENLNLRKSTA